MTPKEKDKQLYESFIPEVQWKMGQEDIAQRAKQCALIAVDEMIEVAYWQGVKDYLKEVKQEIENYEF